MELNHVRSRSGGRRKQALACAGMALSAVLIIGILLLYKDRVRLAWLLEQLRESKDRSQSAVLIRQVCEDGGSVEILQIIEYLDESYRKRSPDEITTVDIGVRIELDENEEAAIAGLSARGFAGLTPLLQILIQESNTRLLTWAAVLVREVYWSCQVTVDERFVSVVGSEVWSTEEWVNVRVLVNVIQRNDAVPAAVRELSEAVVLRIDRARADAAQE